MEIKKTKENSATHVCRAGELRNDYPTSHCHIVFEDVTSSSCKGRTNPNMQAHMHTTTNGNSRCRTQRSSTSILGVRYFHRTAAACQKVYIAEREACGRQEEQRTKERQNKRKKERAQAQLHIVDPFRQFSSATGHTTWYRHIAPDHVTLHRACRARISESKKRARARAHFVTRPRAHILGSAS